MASRVGKGAGFVVKHVAYALWVSLMVLTPLLGFWLASSLAAYHNASQWLSLLVGLLLFPILPVGWDLFFVWRRSRRGSASGDRPILTGLDRIVLRTLLINGLFLGGMMWQARADAFRALAVRGDWMLDGHHGPIASTLRGWMLGVADTFDRRLAKKPTYGESDKAPDDVPPPDEPAPTPTPTPSPDGSTPAPTLRPAGSWPYPAELHPLVASMPEAEQASIESVGAYMKANVADRRERAKALHDFVIHRLHYDYDALKLIEAHDYKNTPSQDAEAVFARRSAVCEGYSRLLVALGKAADVEIAYITGHIRDSERRLAVSDDPWDTSVQDALEGVGHAWNAVKLDDRWYLMDATWNDPSAPGGKRQDTYRTTYLFTPPRLFAFDHFPEDPKWQLLPEPLSLGDFVRQPLLSPSIGELGLALTSPTRSQITVDGTAVMVLDNPLGAAVAARARREGSAATAADDTRCKVTKGEKTRVECALSTGEYEVQLFAAPAERTQTPGGYTLDYIGSVLVNAR